MKSTIQHELIKTIESYDLKPHLFDLKGNKTIYNDKAKRIFVDNINIMIYINDIDDFDNIQNEIRIIVGKDFDSSLYRDLINIIRKISIKWNYVLQIKRLNRHIQPKMFLELTENESNKGSLVMRIRENTTIDEQEVTKVETLLRNVYRSTGGGGMNAKEIREQAERMVSGKTKLLGSIKNPPSYGRDTNVNVATILWYINQITKNLSKDDDVLVVVLSRIADAYEAILNGEYSYIKLNSPNIYNFVDYVLEYFNIKQRLSAKQAITTVSETTTSANIASIPGSLFKDAFLSRKPSNTKHMFKNKKPKNTLREVEELRHILSKNDKIIMEKVLNPLNKVEDFLEDISFSEKTRTTLYRELKRYNPNNFDELLDKSSAWKNEYMFKPEETEELYYEMTNEI